MFLIVTAGVLYVLMCVYVYDLVRFIKINSNNDVGDMAAVMSYVSNIAVYIREICLLAVVDFLFCVGQKRYNKNMLAISVASFALAIILYIMSSAISGLFTLFFNKLNIAPSTTMSYFYLWTVLSTLPFVGLTVSYIVVKAKYLKTVKQENCC